MPDQETMLQYESLLALIDESLKQKNPLLSSAQLSELLDSHLICELMRLTGHSGTYFISSEPNGVRLNITQIKRVYNKISDELEEWRFNRG